MASAVEMMSDSGWPDMPNKHIVMLSIFLATAAAAVGQEGLPATGSESPVETPAAASTNDTDDELSDEVQTQARARRIPTSPSQR
jgi:hypothetical protein